jgi:hypothetical protein
MLVRATTKSYNQVIAELIRHLYVQKRETAGEEVETFLKGQTSDSRYWPDDQEIRDELRNLAAFQRLRRGRLRMVLEAIEDHRRGWIGERDGLGGERVARGKYTIEHVLPRKWVAHWPLADGDRDVERDALVHTIGNLTLLTSALNSKVSNGPWIGGDGKREGLRKHDILLLNRELLRSAEQVWTHTHIRSRCDEMSNYIIEIWPAPEGHRSGFARARVRSPHAVGLSDLITAGSLAAGVTLYARQKQFADTTATLLSDGRIDVNGKVYSSPSEAAKTIAGHPMNGWWFFLTSREPKRSLKDVRLEYLESLASDLDDEEDDDETDDEA